MDQTLEKNLNIQDIMDSWTLKKGYPVVQVDRISSSNLSDSNLKVKQSWFLLNQCSKSQNASFYENYKWFVPFTYTTKSSLNFDFERKPFWLKPNESECIFKKYILIK
jgi:hypothetical protein